MTCSNSPLTIVQILPALNAGGVERGTLEFARELVKRGHRSIVISNGGGMVSRLQAEGTTHIQLPVHRKSLRSLLWVNKLGKTLNELSPDIVHVRSRIPAWMTWLTWRRMDPELRPGLVSTFHGLYSVSPYSAIMGKAQRVIAISDCVHQYILENYRVDPAIITRIYRGMDPDTFNPNACTAEWRTALYEQYPEFKGKQLILMPGRLTRWKGQEGFLHMMQRLVKLNPAAHGVIVGGAESNKEHYKQELCDLRDTLGLNNKVTLTGHRNDISAFFGIATVTCHMSNKPEPFGRTVPEALATGCPVVAYDRGGAAESLKYSLPEGLTPPGDIKAFAEKVSSFINQRPQKILLPADFYLDHQASQTIKVYRELLSDNAR